jgi:alkylation response protein AidB-like acyl-CoA dehydrogenase
MIQNRLQLDAAPVAPDRVLGSASSGLAVAAETMGFGRLHRRHVRGGLVAVPAVDA